MKNYTLNSMGWIGVILTILCLSFTSCKKEDNKSAAPLITASVNTSKILGTYTYTGSETMATDTIYIYEQAGHYYMTCPVNNIDTVNINIIDSISFMIPEQPIWENYSSNSHINGNAVRVGASQLTVNWDMGWTSKSNLYYYKL